mgnify:CR=1 FL=1
MKNTILFDKHEVFVNGNRDTIPSLLDTNSDLLIDMFKGFKYPISSWPVILTNELKNDLEEASIAIPRLLQEIPALYFDNDVKRIADFYFQGNQELGQFSMLCHSKKVEVSCRLDLTYTENGFKVLEVNMGSSIGGMEFQNFEPLMQEMHPVLSTENKQFLSRETQSIYTKFLIDKVEEYVSSTDAEIGVFLVSEKEEQVESKQIVKNFFNQLLEKELSKRGKKGHTQMASINALQFKAGQLQYNGKKIHLVLTLDFAENNISPSIFRALITDSVYFPDHLGTMFMRDKRNLAILRTLALANKFSEQDNARILKYIPWTAIVADTEVQYEDAVHNMSQLLTERKEDFVIKIADGLQGTDVFVGKFQDQARWEEIIQMAIKEKKYIAQEFSQSIDMLAPNKNNEWKTHKLVWGAFGFGKTYGGAWVRMSANQNDAGVINSATGAVEALVYETI